VTSLRDLLSDCGCVPEFCMEDRNVYLEIYERSEDEIDKLARKDKLPLLWKVDPMVARDFGKNAIKPIYAVNNAQFTFVEADGEEKVKKAWVKQFVTVQPDFDLERCQRNSRLLMLHFIEVFRGFFKNMKVEGFLKGLKD